ncbi:hypothetical protein IHE44_0000324, partial [Lamprotornis superbus]
MSLSGSEPWTNSLSNTIRHPDFCVFISAKPAPTTEEHIIPQGIVENSIKITGEPPTRMLANFHAALYGFDQIKDSVWWLERRRENVENRHIMDYAQPPSLQIPDYPCVLPQELDKVDLYAREGEFKSILFPLCNFHTCVPGRVKFGPRGWNGRYLIDQHLRSPSVSLSSATVQRPTRSWKKLKPRITAKPENHSVTGSQMNLEGELGTMFLSPTKSDYDGYSKYIAEMLPSESPVLYGLHPDAEMGFLTTSDNSFKTPLEKQPKDTWERDQTSLHSRAGLQGERPFLGLLMHSRNNWPLDKAIPVDQLRETKNVYECSANKNKSRRTTYVLTFKLKIKKSDKWVLAGIALLLAVLRDALKVLLDIVVAVELGQVDEHAGGTAPIPPAAIAAVAHPATRRTDPGLQGHEHSEAEPSTLSDRLRLISFET